ncbi:MAG: GtrA family protein [Planctomycetota bacterium]|jgi:putative flippase GtrA
MRSLKRLLTEPVESTLLQMPRALIASCLAAALDVSILVLFVEQFSWNPAAAAAVGYLAGVVLQYVLCMVWVFPTTADNNAGFVAFALFSLVGLGITWGVLKTLCDVGGFSYPTAKFAALGIAFSWNFLSRKWLLFRAARTAYDINLPATPNVRAF